MDGREDEIWSPCFVMCDLFCPERRPELERAAADICAAKRAAPKKVSASEAKRRSDSVRDGERLKKDLLSLCGEEDGIRTGEALTRLKEINNAPWRNYEDKPEGLTAIKLAALLRPLGIRPGQFKRDGVNRRGYLRRDLEGAVAPNPLPRYRLCQIRAAAMRRLARVLFVHRAGAV